MTDKQVLAFFGIEDINDLPGAVSNLLKQDLETRNKTYQELIRLNNNDMSYDWFQQVYEKELAQRKKSGQDFTPVEVSKLTSLLTGTPKGWIHEPTAGTGGLVIADWWNRCSKGLPWEHSPHEHMVSCWELSNRSIPILLLNLSIRGIMGYVYHGDVLTQEVKMKYVLLNRKSDTLGFSEVIEDPDNKLTIKQKT